jgi:hypothetical protein
MPFPRGLIGLVYSIVGLLFAFNSAPNSSTTHWGYALTGITCLIIGAKFLGMPLNREALTEKAVKHDPFE